MSEKTKWAIQNVESGNTEKTEGAIQNVESGNTENRRGNPECRIGQHWEHKIQEEDKQTNKNKIENQNEKQRRPHQITGGEPIHLL